MESIISYDIDSIPKGKSVIEMFPELMAQAEVFANESDLPRGVDNDKVMRYIIYMFAPNSKVKEELPDISKRKQVVLKKLNISDSENHDGYGEMCLMQHEWIVKRFIAFTRLHFSEDYALMSVSEIRMSALQKALLTSPIGKSGDDAKFQKDLEGWRETFSEARKRIMQEEKSVVLQRAITFSAKSTSLNLSPEYIAPIFRATGNVLPHVRP